MNFKDLNIRIEYLHIWVSISHHWNHLFVQSIERIIIIFYYLIHSKIVTKPSGQNSQHQKCNQPRQMPWSYYFDYSEFCVFTYAFIFSVSDFLPKRKKDFFIFLVIIKKKFILLLVKVGQISWALGWHSVEFKLSFSYVLLTSNQKSLHSYKRLCTFILVITKICIQTALQFRYSICTCSKIVEPIFLN